MRSCQDPPFLKIWQEVQPLPPPSRKEDAQYAIVSPSLSFLLPGSCQVCFLFYKKYFINLFSLIRLLQKIMHFQSNTNLFFQLIAGQFWVCWFMYMFLRALFDSFAIMKLQIATNFEVGNASIILSYLYHFDNVNKELFRYC